MCLPEILLASLYFTDEPQQSRKSPAITALAKTAIHTAAFSPLQKQILSYYRNQFHL